MSQDKEFIDVLSLNDELKDLFHKATKKAISIHKKNKGNFQESFEEIPPSHNNITLKCTTWRGGTSDQYIKFDHLEIRNVSIKNDNENNPSIIILEVKHVVDPSIIIPKGKHGVGKIDKITFDNVTFLNDFQDEKEKCKQYLSIELFDHNSVDFINCCSCQTNLKLICAPKDITKDIDKECKIQSNCGIEISHSSFKELQIYMRPCKKSSQDEKICKYEKPCRDSVKYKLFILISANIIKGLKFSVPEDNRYECKAKIVNKNKIKFLRSNGAYPDIMAWGLRENIGEGIECEYELADARKKIDNNKEALMNFKKLANDKGDKVQEANINYNIASCDDQLIRVEPAEDFWQEQLIMILGRCLSRHGTSWLLPLLWILTFNIIFGIATSSIIYFSCSGYIELTDIPQIIGSMLNPLTTSPVMIEEINATSNCSFWAFTYFSIYGLFLLSKGLYAICIYEFFRTARRFTLK